MATRKSSKTYHFEDYNGWTIAVAKDGPGQWHGFARLNGNRRGRFTLSTLNTGSLMSRGTALDAIRFMVDEEG